MDCWICGKVADSKEHKFKASDIKKALGKNFNATFFQGEKPYEFSSYKDDIIQFPKVICIECNNRTTRKHDDAYDIFVKYCLENINQILINGNIDYKDIFGDNWAEEKINLHRYYAKHAGCKVRTSNIDFDLENVSKFILGENMCEDFIFKFEIKTAIILFVIAINKIGKYYHLFNSETSLLNLNESVAFGGWLTNNFLTANWVVSKNISKYDSINMSSRYENVIITDFNFPSEILEPQNFSDQAMFLNAIVTKYENGYNDSNEKKEKFYSSFTKIK